MVYNTTTVTPSHRMLLCIKTNGLLFFAGKAPPRADPKSPLPPQPPTSQPATGRSSSQEPEPATSSSSAAAQSNRNLVSYTDVDY